MRSQEEHQAVDDERQRAENYLNLADIFFLGLDRQGRVTLINPKGCEILGLPAGQVIGKNWFEEFAPQDSCATDMLRRDLRRR
jgi:PAS domain S-box-containing protein